MVLSPEQEGWGGAKALGRSFVNLAGTLCCPHPGLRSSTHDQAVAGAAIAGVKERISPRLRAHWRDNLQAPWEFVRNWLSIARSFMG